MGFKLGQGEGSNKLKIAGAASLQRDKPINVVDREHNNSEVGHYQRKPMINDASDWNKNNQLEKQSTREQYPNRRISRLE